MKKKYCTAITTLILICNMQASQEPDSRVMNFITQEMKESGVEDEIQLNIGNSSWAISKKTDREKQYGVLDLTQADYQRLINIFDYDKNFNISDNKRFIDRVRGSINHEANHYKLGHADEHRTLPTLKKYCDYFIATCFIYGTYSTLYNKNSKPIYIGVAAYVAIDYCSGLIRRREERQADDMIRDNIDILKAKADYYEHKSQSDSFFSDIMDSLFSTHPTNASRAARFRERITTLQTVSE